MKTNTPTDRHTEFLINLVSLATETSRCALLKHRRGAASEAHARQIAMYLSHVSFGNSLAKVGEQFGRDKSTVGHAVHLIEDLRENEAFETWISDLEQTLDAGRRVLSKSVPCARTQSDPRQGVDRFDLAL